MTAIAVKDLRISPEEYLKEELVASQKHEYVAGAVFAMAGNSRNHNEIAANLLSILRGHLKGKQCSALGSDMKLKVSAAWGEAFYYPDVTVACDPTDRSEYFLERPTIIFEILSPSTETVDRREKRVAYTTIPSLEVYVLIEQDRIEGTAYRRTDNGWAGEIITGADVILKLAPIQLDIRLGDLYDGTTVRFD